MNIRDILKKKPFFIVGHRGAKGRKPENTLTAIEYGIKSGADIVEVDVRRTKDNKLILLHDPDFKRVSGKDLKPSQLTLSQIKENISIYGEPVATLEEALKLINGKTGLFIEIKEPETTEDILELILKNKALEWTAVISFYDEPLEKAKKLLPGITTGLIYMKPPGRIFDAKNLGSDLVLPFYKIATQKANALAHKLHLKVVVWTVNDEKTALKVLEKNVDGIATDYPDLLADLRKKLS
jgi:glycerophosphoryl diester phosphodiesterase